MYEQLSVRQVVERVLHIYGLYQGAPAVEDRRLEKEARLRFLRSVIDNLKHQRSILSPRMLGELSRYAGLTIGGSFSLVGYPLDRLREIEYLLNGHRTRIIESYPFYRDREIDLPRLLSGGDVFERTAFISEIVLDWQTHCPIRSLREIGMQRNDIFYVQLGAESSMALSGIPPGAILSIERVSRHEELNPDPNSIYCLQFSDGYRCCRCARSQGRLTLLLNDNNYAGPYIFIYSQDVRIVGKARAFAVSLPPAVAEIPDTARPQTRAPLVLPWEQTTLSSLWRTKRMRFGLTEQALVRANDLLASLLGISLSGRTLRRYQHEAGMTPHTNVLVGLTLFHVSRFSDVFRLLDLWHDESNRYSLTTLMNARSLEDLCASQCRAESPGPQSQWEALLGEWGEWPALLSMTLPHIVKIQERLLRIRQTGAFDGLAPVVKPGAIALLEETSRFPNTTGDRGMSEWERPIYAIRHGEQLLCGYLDNDGDHLTLIPHPRSRARRLSFLRHQVEMVGKWMGIASPL